MTQMVVPVAVPANAETPSPPAVERAFQLGWSLTELKGRVAIEAKSVAGASASDDQDAAAQILADPLRQDLWRGSMWRVAFDRVSSLHATFATFRAVPNNVLYDPGENLPDYLFPDPSADYATTGALWPDDSSNPILPQFRLREATRRALNCLDLLYLEPSRTVQSTAIAKNQAALLQKLAVMLGGAEVPQAPAGTLPTAGAIDEKSRQQAIVRLTQVTLTLLDTWDAYLREQFADIGWTKESEHNLVAYEAGRALSALSWNLSRELLGKTSGGGAPNANDSSAVATGAADGATPATTQSAATETRSTDPLELAWQQGFSDRNVSYMQHMLAVLGQALDDAADASQPKPSTTIRAVVRSIELWQRSVRWLCDGPARARHGLGDQTVIDDNLRVALIEQSAIWQALVLGQEELTSYSAPGIAERLYLEATIEVEQAINPSTLGAVGAQVVRYGGEVLNDIEVAVHQTLDKVVSDAAAAASDAANSVVRRFWPWLLGVAALLVLMLVLVYLASPQNATPTVVNGVGGLLVTGLALLHLKSASQQQTDQATQFTKDVAASVNTARATATTKFQDARSTVSEAISSARTDAQGAAAVASAPDGVPAQLLGGLSGKAGALLQYVQTTGENALTKAQGEVQTAVAELERVMAISYPLIDYVVAVTRRRTLEERGDNAADSTFNFLEKVVWTPDDRKQELLQVASAAFGPLGVIALASVYGEKGNNGQVENGAASQGQVPAIGG